MMDSLRLNLTLNAGDCPGEAPDCYAAQSLPPEGRNLSMGLDGPVYIGGVPQWTPYMRTKAKSTSGFTGCLGVSRCSWLQDYTPYL